MAKKSLSVDAALSPVQPRLLTYPASVVDTPVSAAKLRQRVVLDASFSPVQSQGRTCAAGIPWSTSGVGFT